MPTADDILRRKRDLHVRIGRSRRRIDARLRTSSDSARRLVSWRTYVVRHPGWSLAAALGAGLAAANLMRPGRIGKWLGAALVRQAFGGIGQQMWRDLWQTWRQASRDEK